MAEIHVQPRLWFAVANLGFDRPQAITKRGKAEKGQSGKGQSGKEAKLKAAKRKGQTGSISSLIANDSPSLRFDLLLRCPV